MISVVVPTYNEPDCLDLCIGSFLTGQHGDNEIIAVVDGTAEQNERVIKKYGQTACVRFVILPENRGMCIAQNMGVRLASSNRVLLVNDDHVFAPDWDVAAAAAYQHNTITSFVTVSHESVWHKYMVQKDFGRTPSEFDIRGFMFFKHSVQKDSEHRWFAAFPIMMNRYKYMALGGFDANCAAGVYADNDLFIKAKIMGMKFDICVDTCFYHFGSVASHRNGGWSVRVANHNSARAYVREKWGHDLLNDDCHYVFSKDDDIEF